MGPSSGFGVLNTSDTNKRPSPFFVRMKDVSMIRLIPLRALHVIEAITIAFPDTKHGTGEKLPIRVGDGFRGSA